ncbi:hypothetical protein Taro_016200 [Colocasia esculenta]|uniref:Uncharacterized protein n=1 Tax=Colocasia esculenta TaxID=4460 RepID=A0A843UJN1_COLES|nr:hypothetical protein [Colocasia esculenta]
MSPSKWSKVMSEMHNELTGVVCRIEERNKQTRRELKEFGIKVDSLFKQMKSYMAKRKFSTTEPENEAKDMTNMDQTEEGRGSSTSLAPMDVDELDKVVEMAGNVATLKKEEDKEEYKVIAMNEEEDPEATNSIKHGQAIDIGFQFLIEKMENSPNEYHIRTYTPALLVHNFQSNKEKIPEWVTLLDAFFKFCGIMDDPLELIYDDQCPDQSSDSTDGALFVIKFMETISKKGEIEWRFSQADMPLIRAQFAVEVLTYASAKSLTC